MRASSRAPAAPARPPPLDAFGALHAKLSEGLDQNFVIKGEAWQKLFSEISSIQDADMAMGLMLRDAHLRDAIKFDWVTHGYGQSTFQLVKAAAAVRAYHVTDWVLEHRSTLRFTISNDTFPHLLRKLASAQADTNEMERVYDMEKTVRGRNSHAGFYELSRVYKRNKDISKLQALLSTATSEAVQVKPEIVEDINLWLRKHA